jgi:hypothetical protein
MGGGDDLLHQVIRREKIHQESGMEGEVSGTCNDGVCSKLSATFRQLIQGDYKLCERLHDFNCKTVISTQKLSSRH